MKIPSQQQLSAEILANTADFAALEEQWDELYHNSPLATPFQSWAWLYSWWEFYGGDCELRLVIVHSEDNLLVGILPLMLQHQQSSIKLLFVGGGYITPYKDILVREGWESQVAEAAADALERITGWHVVDLHEIRPTAAAWNIFERWKGPRIYIWKVNHLLIEAKPWDELLMSLSKKQRKNARRALRQAEADGVYYKSASAAHSEEAARRLVSLHRELWQGRAIDPEHLTQRYESFIATAARRMTACDLGEIYELWKGEKVTIAGFMMFGKEFDGAYMVGASQEAVQRYQWSALTRYYTVMAAYNRNSAYLSLMDGDPPHKLRWAAKKVPAYRLVLSRNPAYLIPYASYLALHSKIRQYLHSDSAPQWVKDIPDKYRALRDTMLWTGK